MSTWYHLVNFLAENLGDTISVRRRQGLLNGTGFNHLAADLILEGSARTFTQELLQKLHSLGADNLIAFLEAVRDNYDWSPADAQTIEDFLAEIRAKSTPQWENWRGRLPRIYLAYQPTADDGPPFLSEIKTALVDNGFEVVELAAEEVTDAQWRSRLLRGIGNCHGGVILLDKESIPANGEVFLEQNMFFQDATLLRWRDWRDDEFILVPVYVSGVLGSALAKPPWQQLDLTEIQPIEAADNAAAIEQILQRLAPLRERPTKPTWIVSMEKDLAARLRKVKKVDPQRLEDTLFALDGGLIGDENKYTLERRVARALLSKGLAGMGPIIDRAAGSELDAKTLNDMVEFLSSSWVDLRAAALIPRYTFMPPDKRIFCVNGIHPELAGDGYIQQACQDYRGLEFFWKVIKVNEDDIEKVIDQEIRPGLIENIRSVKMKHRRLKRQSGGDTERLNKETDKLINQRLAKWDDERMPVFVVFGPDQFDPAKLETIRRTYPRLTFFLLVGSQASTSPIAGVDMLFPRLKEDAEELGEELYFDLLDKIPEG